LSALRMLGTPDLRCWNPRVGRWWELGFAQIRERRPQCARRPRFGRCAADWPACAFIASGADGSLPLSREGGKRFGADRRRAQPQTADSGGRRPDDRIRHAAGVDADERNGDERGTRPNPSCSAAAPLRSVGPNAATTRGACAAARAGRPARWLVLVGPSTGASRAAWSCCALPARGSSWTR
jgi:hypothetical protein